MCLRFEKHSRGVRRKGNGRLDFSATIKMQSREPIGTFNEGAEEEMRSIIHVSDDERRFSVRYEVHRLRAAGRAGVQESPSIEEFLGLDRARLVALAFALDGPVHVGHRFTGLIRVYEVFYRARIEVKRSLIDEIDERVAARILTEARFPIADQMAVSVEEFQAELDSLLV